MKKKSQRRQRIAKAKLDREFAYGDWMVQRNMPALSYRQWCHPQMRAKFQTTT